MYMYRGICRGIFKSKYIYIYRGYRGMSIYYIYVYIDSWDCRDFIAHRTASSLRAGPCAHDEVKAFADF